ncbi:hypothetical protein VCRA217O315_160078 [Vibrio crassostreae]|nr:hypothetical protein VCRA217O315_160078 [Vibrio crassostreae]
MQTLNLYNLYGEFTEKFHITFSTFGLNKFYLKPSGSLNEFIDTEKL